MEIGGLKIHFGDLIHGDRHGVHTIQLAIAADIPRMAAQIVCEEGALRELCQSTRFHCKVWTTS